jgi:hypothetical protein
MAVSTRGRCFGNFRIVLRRPVPIQIESPDRVRALSGILQQLVTPDLILGPCRTTEDFRIIISWLRIITDECPFLTDRCAVGGVSPQAENGLRSQEISP